MAKREFKKFTVTISYKIEVNEDYKPNSKTEKKTWKDVCSQDGELVGAKVSVVEG